MKNKVTQTNLRDDTREQIEYLADRWKMPKSRYIALVIGRCVDIVFKQEKMTEQDELGIWRSCKCHLPQVHGHEEKCPEYYKKE